MGKILEVLAHRLRILIIASLTLLVFNRIRLNQFLLLLPDPFYYHISDDWHQHLAAFAAPSPNILRLYFSVAVGAGSLRVQPTVDTAVVEVVAALSDEQGVGVQAN